MYIALVQTTLHIACLEPLDEKIHTYLVDFTMTRNDSSDDVLAAILLLLRNMPLRDFHHQPKPE
jgi:hypothetical protein